RCRHEGLRRLRLCPQRWRHCTPETTSLLVLLLAITSSLSAGLPYRLEQISEIGAIRALLIDVDRDGTDELLTIRANSLSLVSQDGTPARERWGILNLRPGDCALLKPIELGPGQENEIFISYCARDTGWALTWNLEGRPDAFDPFPLYPDTDAICSRACSTGFKVRSAELLDADADGQPDLILAAEIGAGHTAARGVWAVNPRMNQTIWHWHCGMLPVLRLLDLGSAGDTMILVHGYAISNGNEAGGIPDWESWIICLSRYGEEQWRRKIGEDFVHSEAQLVDLDRDGQPDLVVFERGGPPQRPSPARILILDPRTGSCLNKAENLAGFDAVVVGDFTGDGHPEFVISGRDDTIRMYDWQLRILARRYLRSQFKPCDVANIDHKGRAEILGSTARNSVMILDSRLRILAEERIPWDFEHGSVRAIRAFPRVRVSVHRFADPSEQGFPAIAVFDILPTVRTVPVWVLALVILGAVFLGSGAIYGINRSHRTELNAFVRGLVSGAGVIRLSSQGRIRTTNRPALDLLGVPYAPSDQDFATFCVRNGLPALQRFVASGLRARLDSPIETTIAAGKRNLLIRLCPLRRELLLTIEDLSAVEYLRRVQTWLPVASRLAHDLKSPLTAMRLVVQQLGRERDEKADESLALLDSEIGSLARMADSLMKLTQLDPPRLEPRPVQSLLDRALSKYACHEGITLDEQVSADLPPVLVDENQLLIALGNILENAVASMKGQGTLTVAASLTRDNSHVQLRIADTGPGIPKDALPRIFEPFFSLKPGGTGLGLAITKKILDDHHAEIAISSQAGTGTAVTVKLRVAGTSHA
ncbi:MAG: ATP-binding protein, partial [candidate division WOR-3 bacterium]